MLIQSITHWKLAGFWPNVAEFKRGMELGNTLEATVGYMDAEVPGNVYKALMDHGYIADPYIDMNSLSCEWVANREWVYKTSLWIDSKYRGRRLFLRFGGIDYRATVYINEKEVGEHEGMFVPLMLDITDSVHYDEENAVKVVLTCPPQEHGQIGFTSRTHTQKSRFNYKWDFCTRLVNIGLYEPVTLECYSGGRIAYAKVTPFRDADGWKVHVGLELERYGEGMLDVEAGLYDGTTLLATVRKEGIGGSGWEGKLAPKEFHPRLWWPNGYGEQPLYSVRITLKDGKGVADNREYPVGFRKLRYKQPQTHYEGPVLPYQVEINGKNIYLKGVNMVPLDLMYGGETEEDYRRLLEMARAAGVNLIRVWGGGFIERECFYRLCDEMGIMVWQEFLQSSSGGDNVPSRIPSFLKLLQKTSLHAVKEKRNHVSLTFWSGGNELSDREYIACDDRNDHPVTYEDENIAMLKEIVERENPEVLMLPSSPSGGVSFLNNDVPERNHDVHGLWQYAGVTEHYRLYNDSHSLLQSEFGCEGMSSLASLKRFLSPCHQVVTTIAENLVWRHHGEWWDSYETREKKLFGEFGGNELEALITVCQFMQAEGIRYVIEANRRRIWENCGSIVWQFNEPWPNTACTSIVEYFGTPKLAYYFMRDAFRSCTPTLRYDSLVYKAGETFLSEVFILNDRQETQGTVTVTARTEDGEILTEERMDVRLPDNGTVHAGTFSLLIPASAGDSFRVYLLLEANGIREESEYLFLVPDKKSGLLSRRAVLTFVSDYLLGRGGL